MNKFPFKILCPFFTVLMVFDFVASICCVFWANMINFSGPVDWSVFDNEIVHWSILLVATLLLGFFIIILFLYCWLLFLFENKLISKGAEHHA